MRPTRLSLPAVCLLALPTLAMDGEVRLSAREIDVADVASQMELGASFTLLPSPISVAMLDMSSLSPLTTKTRERLAESGVNTAQVNIGIAEQLIPNLEPHKIRLPAGGHASRLIVQTAAGLSLVLEDALAQGRMDEGTVAKARAVFDEELKRPLLRMPVPTEHGFLKTVNGTGYVMGKPDEFSRRFIKFVPRAPGPVLEVGAAYGVAVHEALAAGAHVLANDMEPDHLFLLHERTPLEYRSRLTLVPGRFPDEFSFKPGTLGAILLCRVMLFFQGPALEHAAATVFRWLAHEGQVYVVSYTPYSDHFKDFVPIYEQRKREGQDWPGMISHSDARGELRPAHVLDPDVLRRVFKAAGFAVQEARMFGYDYTGQGPSNDKEMVGMIARKP